jgi:hypothetical protein
LVPLASDKASPTATLTHDLPTSFQKCPIYDSWGDLGANGFYDCVQVVVKNIRGPLDSGSLGNIDSLKGRVVYEKTFKRQSASVVMKKWVEGGQVMISPPGLKGGEPLWPYGGYYRPGCPLENIEQVIFTVTNRGENTTIFPTRLSHWLLKGIHPWRSPSPSQTTIFMETIEEKNAKHLKADIENGAIMLPIAYGMDPKGHSLEVMYHSTHATLVDGVLGTVEITLEKGELA